MKQKIMTIWLLSLILASQGHAQTSEAEDIARIRFYASKLGLELKGTPIAEETGMNSIRIYYFGELSWCVRPDGSLATLRVGQPLEEADKEAPDFGDDEAAWARAETILRTLNLEEGRVRGKIVWEGVMGPIGGSDCPNVICTFGPQPPYGYKVAGGNSVEIGFRRRDGALFRILVGVPITYERPNIQISEAQARAVAIGVYGGKPEDWNVSEPFYTIGTDSYVSEEIRNMAENRVMRLCYGVGSSLGRVTVDTVKGSIVYKATPPMGSHPPSSLSKSAPKPKSTSKEAHGQTAQPPPKSNPIPLVMGGIASFSAILLALKLRRGRKRALL